MNKKLILLFLPLLLTLNIFAQQDILTLEAKASADKVLAGGEFQVAVVAHILHPWHINSWKPLDEFSIPTEINITESANYTITDIKYPDHKLIELSISDEPSALYEGDITIFIKGKISDEVANSVTISGNLRYQGCNNTSCLPPADKSFSLTLPVVREKSEINPANKEIFSESAGSKTDMNIGTGTDSEGFDVTASFEEKGIFLTYFLILLGGLGLVLTPCVYPLIPITMSYFGGQVSNNKGKTIVLALLYVLGMAIINSTIGTVAALSGGLLGAFMTNPVVLIFIAAVLVALSLSMFGVYEFGLPSFLTNLGGGAKSGYVGALLMGMTMGVVAAPCIGPFVIGLLTYVASTGNPVVGFSMFFTLSVGLGIPFIFLAFASGKISKLPKAGDWMVGVRVIFGLILIGMALYFLNPIIPDAIFKIVLPLFLALSGIYLLLFNKAGESTKAFSYFKKLLAILAIFAAGFLTKPQSDDGAAKMDWQPFSQEYYEAAVADNRPVMIDFFADWCIPCKELDKLTFTNEAIIELSQKFNLIKVDLTDGGKGKVQELREKYAVKGVPTIVFIDKKGNELKELRTLGFVEADVFIEKMKKTVNN
jgi:thiol:disulfide interchange protein DsbD